MAKVAIIGAGLMGTAMCWPLSDNGHQVRLVGTHLDAEAIASCKALRRHPRLGRVLPDHVEPYSVDEVGQALQDVELVVSGVNSHGVHWMGGLLARWLPPGVMVLAVTKGLEAGAGGKLAILPDVLAGFLPEPARRKVPIAAIAGPCIAGELAGRRHSCVIFTSRDRSALPHLRDMLQTWYYHVALAADVVGVEACAALKNAFTLAVGMAEGLLERHGGRDEAGAGMFNPAAALFGESMVEMARLVELMGGDPLHVTGLAGAGDEFVTCVGGRTIRLGRLLGQGLNYVDAQREMAGETLESAAVVEQVARVLPVWEHEGLVAAEELPLMRMVCRVITQNAPVEIPFAHFMRDRL
jgi:glycerol-3-phosphate dehydrogenase (NAD(P)+)